MIKPIIHAAMFSSLVVLAACGGGGSAGSDNDAGTGSGGAKLVVGQSVAGPLDPIQTEVGTAVFDPLQSAVAGTALEPVVSCTNAIVNGDVVDIADTVLVALQAAAADPAGADPQALVESTRALAIHLTQLLEGMAGQAVDCTSDALDIQHLQNLVTTLQDTPFAPLATALAPVVQQIVEVVGAQGASSATLATIDNLIMQLSAALQQGLAQIPAGSTSTPIVGGALSTVSTALVDVHGLLNAALQRDAAATGTALQALVDHALVNLLTQVLPLQQIEAQGGQPGLISDRIVDAAAQLSTVIGNSVGKVLDPAFEVLLSSALAPVLDPVVNSVLPAVIEPIFDALDGLAGDGDNSGPLSGTVLAPVVNLLETILGGLFGQTGDGDDGSTACVFANFPLLSRLCPQS